MSSEDEIDENALLQLNLADDAEFDRQFPPLRGNNRRGYRRQNPALPRGDHQDARPPNQQPGREGYEQVPPMAAAVANDAVPPGGPRDGEAIGRQNNDAVPPGGPREGEGIGRQNNEQRPRRHDRAGRHHRDHVYQQQMNVARFIHMLANPARGEKSKNGRGRGRGRGNGRGGRRGGR